MNLRPARTAEGVERVGRIVRAMQEAGRTVIAVTHDMAFATQRFDRIVVMRAGEIVADGPPDEVFAPGHRDLLASTGLTPPPAARIAARIGLDAVCLDAPSLLAALHRSTLPPSPLTSPG